MQARCSDTRDGMDECARCADGPIIMFPTRVAEQLGYLRVYVYPSAGDTAILQKRGYLPPKRRASQNTVPVVLSNGVDPLAHSLTCKEQSSCCGSTVAELSGPIGFEQFTCWEG